MTCARLNNIRGASRTHIDRVAGLYVTGNNGMLIASAGNDLNLIAAAVQSQGSATLAARNNVKLDTATEASSNRITWDGNNRRSDRTTTDIGTVVQSQGNAQLIAGQDINARAAAITSNNGAVSALAGRDINLTTGQATAQVDEAHQHTAQGFLNSTTRTTKDTLNDSTALGSTLSGNTVNIAAKRDVTVQGSSEVSTVAGASVSPMTLRIADT